MPKRFQKFRPRHDLLHFGQESFTACCFSFGGALCLDEIRFLNGSVPRRKGDVSPYITGNSVAAELISVSLNTIKGFFIMKSMCLFFILAVFLPSTSNALTKYFGKGYCSIRHPVAAFTSNRTTCESQHIIQTQSGGSNNNNTIWISTTLHDYLDRSTDKPWESERPWTNLGDDNLERAYMMGTYANGYHFITYKHHRDGDLTLFEWDGVSHFVYAVSSVMNFITKEMSYIGYQMDLGSRGRETQYIDAMIGIFINFLEIIFGVIYSILGILVGTIFNPIDTLTNIPGGITLSIETTIEGIANTISDIILIVTLGYVEL
jgi:hypothetical protein